jgi:hypothetical protein
MNCPTRGRSDTTPPALNVNPARQTCYRHCTRGRDGRHEGGTGISTGPRSPKPGIRNRLTRTPSGTTGQQPMPPTNPIPSARPMAASSGQEGQSGATPTRTNCLSSWNGVSRIRWTCPLQLCTGCFHAPGCSRSSSKPGSAAKLKLEGRTRKPANGRGSFGVRTRASGVRT